MKERIGFLGKGKTGRGVIDLLYKNIIVSVFDSVNTLSIKNIYKIKIFFIFVSSDILLKNIKVLSLYNKVIICGTTGFNWTKSLKNNIIKSKSTWVVSDNFSITMLALKRSFSFFNAITDYTVNIIDIHHKNKLDSPSGTALSWKKLLGIPLCCIKSIRSENIIGTHKLLIQGKYERICIQHKAYSRKLFSLGAIWALNCVLKKNLLGFYSFDKLN